MRLLRTCRALCRFTNLASRVLHTPRDIIVVRASLATVQIDTWRLGVCLLLRTLLLLTAGTLTVLSLSHQLRNHLLTHFEDWKTSVLLIRMTLDNGDVELSYLLPEILALLERLETVLAKLLIVCLRDARFSLRRVLVVHFETGLAKNFFCVSSPLVLCLMLRVGSVECGVPLRMHLDNQLLGIGGERFLDWSPQVAIQRVTNIIVVGRVGVAIRWLCLKWMKVHLPKLILQFVEIYPPRLRSILRLATFDSPRLLQLVDLLASHLLLDSCSRSLNQILLFKRPLVIAFRQL